MAGSPLDLTVETPDAPADQRLQSEARAAAAKVQSSLAGLIQTIAGGARRPRDLQRSTGIDYKICWQVFNVVHAPDSLKAARHTPSVAALKRFLNVAAERGASDLQIEQVRQSVEEFSDLVKRHADDRESFSSMVAGDDDAELASRAIQLRRAAFRAQAQIWGTQVEAHHSVAFMRLSESGRGTAQALVTVKRGLRRTRPEVSPIVYGSLHHSTQNPDKPYASSTLDDQAAQRYGAPVLPRFSTSPLPQLRTVHGAGGWVFHELAGGALGRGGETDLAFGTVALDVPFSVDAAGQQYMRAGTTFVSPVGLYHLDYLVHRPSFGKVLMECLCYQTYPGLEVPLVPSAATRLPLTERVFALGPAEQAPVLPEWSVCGELHRYAAERLGWDLSEFDLYRLKVSYPVIGTMVRAQFRRTPGT